MPGRVGYDVGEAQVVASGVLPHLGERLVHLGDASSTETPRVLARAPVGLLDGRPRGEGYLELLGQDLSLSNGALL
ncbi:MAG TPA: hypothetical protein VNT27_04220 [Propionibacteriaceae bacterium]|nr:hypothetical protein [Propionibacteriaceae bacterium]